MLMLAIERTRINLSINFPLKYVTKSAVLIESTFPIRNIGNVRDKDGHTPSYIIDVISR
jgi:hypothetical protein